jgi:3-hydroxyisobutyrate dehydrogenase
MELGYIGLGIMGGALAKRLMLSHRLRVYDLNPAVRADFVERGATVALHPSEVASACDIIFICVPRSENVREIIFGEGGLRQNLAAGKIIIDQTSGDPNQTRAMAAELEKLSVAFIDAPVSGGARGAEAGTIAILVAAAAGNFQKVEPLLKSISPNVFHCGEVGAGHVLKLINNTISTCNRFATLEGVAMGLKNGLSLETMTEVLNTGGARSRITENVLPALLRGERKAHFALSLMLKDLNLASQLAAASGAPLHFGHLARSLLQVSANMLGPEADLQEVADIVAMQAGAKL